MKGVLRGLHGGLSGEDALPLLQLLVPRLDEPTALQVALMAIEKLSKMSHLAELVDTVLHRRQRVIDRVELVVDACQRLRSYGRTANKISKPHARKLSKKLMDMMAALWRRGGSAPLLGPTIVAADLGSDFDLANYLDLIPKASHSSPEVASAFCEMLLVRSDGLLVLLDICEKFRSGKVFEVHFQRNVRERLEAAMRHFCAVLFTVQKVPRAMWSILCSLQSECEDALSLVGGCTLLLDYRSSMSEATKQLLNYPELLRECQHGDRGQSV